MRYLVYVLLSIAIAGCGGARAAVSAPTATPPADEQTAPAARSPQDSLETFLAKVRRLAAEARPTRPAPVTIEGSDPRLAAALAASMAAPCPETFRVVAREYARLQIGDRAHEYLMKALTMAPRDASTYDALARLWRDSGFPQLGLPDGYRARYYAPASPVVHNTLGTLFQALGRRGDARRSYERALQLDPTAAYALNNICYGWVIDGETRRAVAACKQALRLEPALTAARHNLGLALAASGDVAAARTAFTEGGDTAVAHYNIGIVQLARRQYADALRSFQAAAAARPSLPTASARIRQAERLASAGVEE